MKFFSPLSFGAGCVGGEGGGVGVRARVCLLLLFKVGEPIQLREMCPCLIALNLSVTGNDRKRLERKEDDYRSKGV